MDGQAAVLTVLMGNAGVTSLVPPERIIADEFLPDGTGLPAILIKHVSGTDRNIPAPGATVHVRQRVQVEIYAETNPSRQAVKRAVRKAARANPAPTVAGIQNVTIHTEGEGPNFYNEGSFVRIGEQDFMATYTEES